MGELLTTLTREGIAAPVLMVTGYGDEQLATRVLRAGALDYIVKDPALTFLGELPKRVNELNSADEIVAHCKSGMRSAKAVEFLKQAGFRKVRNMKGGILAWSDKVDPSVPKY